MLGYKIARISVAILSILFLYGCDGTKQDKTARISFIFQESILDTVKIYQLDPIKHSKFNNLEVVLDSHGKGSILMSIPYPVFATIEIEGNSISVFLQDEYDLTIIGQSQEIFKSINFEGIGSIPNNYRKGVQSIYQKFDGVEGNYFWQLDSNAFASRIDSMDSEVSRYNNEYFKRYTVPENLQNLLVTESMLKPIYLTMNYHKIRRQPQEHTSTTIPFDTSLLNAGSPQYIATLLFYLESEIISPLWERSGPSNNDSIRYQFPELLYNTIQTSGMPGSIREFLIANKLYYYFSTGNSSIIIERVYSQWRSFFPNSEYLSDLENKYSQILTLAPGTTAPEIKGITSSGDNFTLSSLKGHVIYIDVWATWCRPCVEQFPASKRLQNEFGENDKVKFLFISIDKDLKKWRQALVKMKLGGIHINVNGIRIRKDYLMPGIPSYILIDQSGRIVTAKAPNPSSGQVKNEIRKLIKQGN